MTTTTDGAPARTERSWWPASPPPPPPPSWPGSSWADDRRSSPIRPGRSARRPSLVARLLLAAGGVDRDVLDEVPEERHRYVGIGGTVVGTAGLAAGSMALLAATTLDVDGWSIALPALLWGLFIFNLDRWLISSTHGTSRRWMLIPRLALAVLLGIVVAEPVVLWTFRSAIEEEIATQRTDGLATTESDLKFCNPTDPTLTEERQQEARCDDLALNVAPPAGQLSEINALRERLARAESDRDTLRLEEIALNDRLQRERAGEGGGDTTGRRGDGPIADALEVDLAALRGRLTTAEATVVSLEEELQAALGTSSDTSGTFAETIEAAITSRLAEESDAFSGQPGLLERVEALGDLTGRHRDLMWARVFLSLFLIALDSMPVFAKAMSGKTTYDRLLQARLSARERAGRSSLTAEGDDWANEIAHRGFEKEQARLVAKRRIDVQRDRELLQLDTAHRADRAAHGGSDAEINEVLFEDGPAGPTINLSWEQPVDDEDRRRNPLRNILRSRPVRGADDPWPRRSRGGPGGRVVGAFDADVQGDGWTVADPRPPEAADDAWDVGRQAEGEGGDDTEVDRHDPSDPPASGGSWFDDVTRLDADEPGR